MNFSDLTLSPTLAVVIFCITCLAGHRYRHVWRAEGPRYQYWIFGSVAALGLLLLAFIPIS